MTDLLRRLLRTPYVLGGREVGKGIDCHGVVCEVAKWRGLPVPDGWQSIRSAWESGDLDAATGFPPGWSCVDADPRDGDVMLYFDHHPWCAIVHQGNVLGASIDHGGPYCVPLYRWKRKPVELWRFRFQCE